MFPSTLIWRARNLYENFGQLARSLQCILSYIAWSLGAKGTSRNSRALAHAPSLPDKSHSSMTSQWSRHHNWYLPGSNKLLKTTQHIKPTEWFLLHKTIFFTTKKERDCIKKAGALWGLSGDCKDSLGPEVPLSIIIYISLDLHRLSRGLTQVL